MSYWLLVLFILGLAIDATSGGLPGEVVDRETRVFAAYLQFGAILFGYLFLILQQGLSQNFFAVEKKARPVFTLLGLWVLFSAIQGFRADNDSTYVLGDFYKFLLLPLLVGLARLLSGQFSPTWEKMR